MNNSKKQKIKSTSSKKNYLNSKITKKKAIKGYSNGINVTKEIKFNENDLVDNAYNIITYLDKTFKLDSRNPISQNKITYKCINKYLKKDKPTKEKYYCNSTITAIRNKENNTMFTYYFSENHSEICLEKYNKLIYKQNKLLCDNKCQKKDTNEIKKEILENKISSLNIANLKLDNREIIKNTLTEKNNLSNISEPNSDSEENEFINLKDKIFNIKDFYNELKRYYKDKKRFNCRQRDFVNYENKLKQIVKIILNCLKHI